MGLGNSKLKKKLNQTVIVNTNAPEFLKSQHDEDFVPEIPESNDNEENVPVLKWHKANQNEGMIKIQREAEIRDIEAIYENSCIREADLFNLMPDHYWTGKENKLPRYFRYQGDDTNKPIIHSNLERIKSSSLNDLVNSNIDFKIDEMDNINVTLSKRSEISFSCPHIKMVSLTSLSKLDKSVPKKGILKNRNMHRTNSATLLDTKKLNYRIENNEKKQFLENNPKPVIGLKKRKVLESVTNNENDCYNCEIPDNDFGSMSENHIDNENPAFSGYFDLSPNRTSNESSQVLKVNIDKKSLIKNNLDKRLNMRPTSMDLANRNILHDQNGLDKQYDFEQTRCVLNEKLSTRPTVTELKKKKIIKFNDFIEVQETDNYDRTINKTWTRLTEHDKEHIRLELNQFKEREMKIHSRSKRFTKFHDMHDE